MGNCFRSCLPGDDSSKALQGLTILSGGRTDVDFTYLIEDTRSGLKTGKRNLFARIFKRAKARNEVLVDGLLNVQNSNYARLNESQQFSVTSRDIQLQCLDARALLARTAASTPTSIDLEWEHETIPPSMIMHDPSGSSWTALPEDFTPSSRQTPQHNSESDWSRVSSANSLEWDSVQNSIQASPPISEIDVDTQLLLSEIERLTNQTLRETGQDLLS